LQAIFKQRILKRATTTFFQGRIPLKLVQIGMQPPARGPLPQDSLVDMLEKDDRQLSVMRPIYQSIDRCKQAVCVVDA